MAYIIAAVVCITAIVLSTKKKSTSQPTPKTNTPSISTEETAAPESEKEPLPVEGAYQKRWLFSYHEKDAYFKLAELCQKYGLYLTAKVRLLDLVEPVKGNPKYKSYFWKIQAKHVDFVLCDKKLVARCIIELDDSSHDAPDRQERDKFVDEVLNSAGYQVIHVRNIDSAALEQQISTIFKVTANPHS